MIVQLLQGEHMKHAGVDSGSVRVVGSWPRDQEEANSIIGQRIKIFSFVGHKHIVSIAAAQACHCVKTTRQNENKHGSVP